MGNKRTITKKGKAKVRTNAAGKPCCYCQRLMVKRSSDEAMDDPGLAVSIEHIFAQSKGGPDEAWNRKISCQRCNGLRSDYPHEIFEPFARYVVKLHPDCPAAILRQALKQYIVNLAQMAVRNQQQEHKALIVAKLDLQEQLKGL